MSRDHTSISEDTSLVEPTIQRTDSTLDVPDANATMSPTQSHVHDECGDVIIFEEDQSEDGYMFAGQGTLTLPLSPLPLPPFMYWLTV